MSAPQIEPFDFSIDLLQCLLWQYDNAPALQSLMQSKQDWLDAAQKQFWNDWIVNVFDLTTANAFGLNVWAAILGLPLTVPSAAQAAKPTFGFTSNNVGFMQSNFAPASTGTTLAANDARAILRVRYFQLVTRGAAPEVNAFLSLVFGQNVYAKTTGAMQVTYTFTAALSSAVKLFLSQFDVLPRPAGCSVTIVTP